MRVFIDSLIDEYYTRVIEIEEAVSVAANIVERILYGTKPIACPKKYMH